MIKAFFAIFGRFCLDILNTIKWNVYLYEFEVNMFFTHSSKVVLKLYSKKKAKKWRDICIRNLTDFRVPPSELEKSSFSIQLINVIWENQSFPFPWKFTIFVDLNSKQWLINNFVQTYLPFPSFQFITLRNIYVVQVMRDKTFIKIKFSSQ